MLWYLCTVLRHAIVYQYVNFKQITFYSLQFLSSSQSDDYNNAFPTHNFGEHKNKCLPATNTFPYF